MKTSVSILTAVFLAAASATLATPTINVIPGDQMRIDTGFSSVSANGGEWDVFLWMDDDNSDSGLPTSYRRWWHVEIADLNTTTGETLNVSVFNSGYSDYIVPVISTDGGDTYTRISPAQSSLGFTVTIPPGISSVRLAKYYPYTLNHFESFRSTVNAHSHVTETSIGLSVQNRDLWMWEITDLSVAATNKERVWIHSAVHPAENTSYFITEGLVNWLLSGDSQAEILLDNIIFDIIPMANPDGVALGNYRTNANSTNLEIQWASPYNTTVPEVEALITKIEEFMGTSGSPGANPIKLLLNLHSSHGVTYPFHYVHTAGSTSPGVNALENQWVSDFRNRSPFINLGSSFSSSLSTRYYVESMMFDRYSSQPAWDDIVAITLEGTYQAGPSSGPSTADDYRQVGMEMGLAVADFFGIDLTNSSVHGWMILDQ